MFGYGFTSWRITKGGGTPVETSFARDEVLLFAKLVASEYVVEFEQFELRPVLTPREHYKGKHQGGRWDCCGRLKGACWTEEEGYF